MLPNFLVALAHIPEPEICLSPAPALSLPCICLNPNAKAPSGCLSPSLGSGYVFLQFCCLDETVHAYKPTHMDREEHLPACTYVQYLGSLDAQYYLTLSFLWALPLAGWPDLVHIWHRAGALPSADASTCGSDQIPLPGTPT